MVTPKAVAELLQAVADGIDELSRQTGRSAPDVAEQVVALVQARQIRRDAQRVPRGDWKPRYEKRSG